jgi:ABC-type lipoprotein export system ATPase subunit
MTIIDNMEERLIIDNFFSIEHFDWKIKDFNILTGEMASGKSLCMKLLYFIEQIFHRNIFFSSISKEVLTKEFFYNNISDKFLNVFHCLNNENNFVNTSIKYSYSNSGTTFDLNAEWNNGRLEWNSEYLNDKLDEWRGFFVNGNTPDAAQNVRTQIYDSLSHDFSFTFPIGAEFIPASRAIAAIANPSDIPDSFLENFIKEDKPFALGFNDILDKNINRILRLERITVRDNKDPNKRTLEAIAPDGRAITPLEFSSGQQELIYLLLFISNLYRTTFIYGQTTCIFIEEPSAHLFPDEQKETIQYIVKIFRELQETYEKKARFFISTHSPYVLNVINNMLKKGYLIGEVNNCPDENKKQMMMNEIDNLSFPHLMINEISAHFIQKRVESMIKDSESGAYLYEEMIEAITHKINDDYNKVRDLIRQFR